jgi:hypothetical protein
MWREVRERIAVKILALDGRVRRKYNGMARYKYDAIITALNKDEELSAGAAAALVEMDKIALSRRRLHGATKAEAERVAHLCEIASKELPALKDEGCPLC